MIEPTDRGVDNASAAMMLFCAAMSLGLPRVSLCIASLTDSFETGFRRTDATDFSEGMQRVQ